MWWGKWNMQIFYAWKGRKIFPMYMCTFIHICTHIFLNTCTHRTLLFFVFIAIVWLFLDVLSRREPKVEGSNWPLQASWGDPSHCTGRLRSPGGTEKVLRWRHSARGECISQFMIQLSPFSHTVQGWLFSDVELTGWATHYNRQAGLHFHNRCEGKEEKNKLSSRSPTMRYKCTPHFIKQKTGGFYQSQFDLLSS